MKKDEFVKLGLDEETAQKCADASAEELKGFIPKSRFDEVNTEKQRLETTLKERDTQLEILKSSNDDVAALKQQIETLQQENRLKEQEHAKEIRQMQRVEVDNELLSAAKAKNKKALSGLLDEIDDAVELEEYRKQRQQQIDALKKSEETNFLFQEENKKISLKGASLGESGVDPTGQPVDVSKMTYDQLCEYYSQQ
ncbi:phage scaffolding protein [Clostridium facile]|uniref:Phage scaffolding protein n=1 Tax=Clostridium facile TaxID=2763035 RepID=A0ABR7INU9_9CLOT|nr:phage scaffolding protein [Clostridium facile]MBC5786749.1 phage scaffolding protein [Clostridium facile]